MTEKASQSPVDTQPLHDERKQNAHASFTAHVGIREKLIFIFLIVKILPLIFLTWIAWQALISLGTILRETSVADSKNALTAMTVENIERISTDTAQKVAEFLYQRDADISYLAKAVAFRLGTESLNPRNDCVSLFADFSETRFGHIRRQENWDVARDGMSWVQVDISAPTGTKHSVNNENEDAIDGVGFTYRPPYGFGDNRKNFVEVPFYDEIALLDKNGMQIAKYVSPHSTKKRFPFPEELLDVSDPKNTFVKAEHYFDELPHLGKDGIYVSDVIGAYVRGRFIGMYTPDYIISKLIDAEISKLEAKTDGMITEVSWKLRILNAELKNDEEKFNSHLDPSNVKVRKEIDRQLGKGGTWKIENKSIEQVSEELKTLGFSELSDEILRIPFEPEMHAYAGAENPRGIRFEGIVRWAKPVLDRDGEVCGYVTFALNHDHLMDMIDHITPMPERYTELSDAFAGNYAFVWDYQCRSIVHPRHYSIVGYNPETGKPETPWLEKTLYDGMIAAGFERADWLDYIATLEDYVPWTGDKQSLAYQSREKTPAADLTKQGLVALDGRYLNNAPQCTGWMDLTREGGSGSFYIKWSGLYKRTTAAAIPYYTGQYSPAVRGNRVGFGFVAIGAGIDDFSRPADDMGDRLSKMVDANIQHTTVYLTITTMILSVVVIFIAIWMASYLSYRLNALIDGITKFHRGDRSFRFVSDVQDEFGHLARSFNEMAESVVRSVHSPLVIIDLDLNIIYANEQCLEVMGVQNLADIVGKSYKTKSVYEYGTTSCPITALLRGEEAEVFYVEQSGKFLRGTANYFTDEHGVKRGYIITSTDMTELSLKQIELQRAKEEAERASQHKSHFLWRMSHELRTPMNAMIGFNDILQSRIGEIQDVGDNRDLTNYLSHLKRSSLDLLSLLNDILEASNLESGTVELIEKPVDLLMMLGKITAIARKNCDIKLIKFTTQFDEFTSSNFLTDELRLRQAISNLLSNAVKYTEENGHVDFIVRQKDRRDGKTLLTISVRDTGIGIAPDRIEKIFHPFEQAETETRSTTSGSGLGLAIVQRVLNLFGTQITVKSEPGVGSEFTFDIWLRENNVESRVNEDSIYQRFVDQKALVIDDLRLNRLVLVNLLHELGFIVDEAKDGKEGAEIFEKSPENTYRIIFMDIQMPVMNGYESTVAIRSLSRADAKSVPIVAISANAFKEDIDRSLESGMNAHYAKPIQKGILAEILTMFCAPSN